MPKERGESGQYRTTVTPDDVLDVLADVRGPVVTSADVADALGVTRETARRKLESLTDDGRLDSRKTAGRVVYWSAESGRERGASPVEERAGQAPDPDPSPRTPTEDTHARAGQDAAKIDADRPGEDPIGDALDGWEPDTDANPRTARAQARRAAEWLRDAGEYRRAGEFRDALAAESSLSPRVWWERHARAGLNHLADHGLVEYTKNRGYRWTGDGGEV